MDNDFTVSAVVVLYSRNTGDDSELSCRAENTIKHSAIRQPPL